MSRSALSFARMFPLRPWNRIWAAGALFFTLGGCNAQPTPTASGVSSAGPNAPTPSSTPPPVALPSSAIPRISTTSGEIALNNLETQMARLELRIARAAHLNTRANEALEAKLDLIDLLLTRAEFLGRVADMERTLALAEEACAQASSDPKAFLARAKVQSMLHRFSSALSDLDKAVQLGMPPDAVLQKRASIWASQGRYADALPSMERAAREKPSLQTLGILATTLGEIGRNEQALQLYGEAISHYRDTSPFPVAWLFFQQGLLWERAEQPKRARAYFEAAVQAFPRYAHATSHLASYLPNDEAIANLRRVLERSDDPEHSGQLSELLRRTGKKNEADQLLEQAQTRYLLLTKQYPEAFADHGARFFLYRANQPQKALELARFGATVRFTEAAYDLWLSAAIAANAPNEMCEAAKQGHALLNTSAVFREMTKKTLDSCKVP